MRAAAEAVVVEAARAEVPVLLAPLDVASLEHVSATRIAAAAAAVAAAEVAEGAAVRPAVVEGVPLVSSCTTHLLTSPTAPSSRPEVAMVAMVGIGVQEAPEAPEALEATAPMMPVPEAAAATAVLAETEATEAEGPAGPVMESIKPATRALLLTWRPSPSPLVAADRGEQVRAPAVLLDKAEPFSRIRFHPHSQKTKKKLLSSPFTSPGSNVRFVFSPVEPFSHAPSTQPSSVAVSSPSQPKMTLAIAKTHISIHIIRFMSSPSKRSIA